MALNRRLMKCCVSARPQNTQSIYRSENRDTRERKANEKSTPFSRNSSSSVPSSALSSLSAALCLSRAKI